MEPAVQKTCKNFFPQALEIPACPNEPSGVPKSDGCERSSPRFSLALGVFSFFSKAYPIGPNPVQACQQNGPLHGHCQGLEELCEVETPGPKKAVNTGRKWEQMLT